MLDSGEDFRRKFAPFMNSEGAVDAEDGEDDIDEEDGEDDGALIEMTEAELQEECERLSRAQSKGESVASGPSLVVSEAETYQPAQPGSR